MLTFTDAQFLSLIEAWLWPLLRVGALLMTAPIVGTRTVPPRVRVILVLAVTGILVPVLPPAPAYDPLSATGLLVSIQQVAIGISMGLTIRLFFFVLEFAGQVIAQQMGLGFASLIDPQTGAQVPVMSQFYVLIATLFFLAVEGHLLLIKLLAESFVLLPVGTDGISLNGLRSFLDWTGQMFSGAVLIALPVIIALLAVNIAFGIMSRAAPQLNIFAVGFPVMMLLGTAIVLLTLGNLDFYLRANIDWVFQLAYSLLTTR